MEQERPDFDIGEVSLRFEPSGSLGFEPRLLSHRLPVKVVALPADLIALDLSEGSPRIGKGGVVKD